jgi:hypothetical protein
MRSDQTCSPYRTNSQTTPLGSPARTRAKSINCLKVPMRLFVVGSFIQFVDPDLLNPDLDPGFQVIPDPVWDPDPRS